MKVKIFSAILALSMAMSAGIVAAQAAPAYVPNRTTVTGDAAG
jgi:hypothetical protein